MLILANKLPYPPKDGGSIATLNMITGMRDAGNQVTCISLNTNKHNFPVEEIPGSISETIRIIGVECDSSIRPARMVANLLFSKLPYIAERFINTEFRKRLTALLEEESFDVIQLEGPYPGLYLDVIRRTSKALVSLRAHNVEHRIWKRKAQNEKNPLKKWYLLNMASRLERFEMEMVSKTDCLVAISTLDEQYFRKNGLKHPSVTVSTGLDLDTYPFSGLPASPTLFFVGALDWLPNQEGLIWFLDHVFDKLLSEVPGLRFHVAGRNAPASFEKQLKREGLIYHGEVENASKFMQDYRIMVAPLLTGSGIRIKILEAMALGRPVVTTPTGIEGIPAENGENVMVATDPETFKNLIVRLISDDDGAGLLAEHARKLIQENFDTFGLSDRLSRFFNEQA